jgi:hypothetical protein
MTDVQPAGGAPAPGGAAPGGVAATQMGGGGADTQMGRLNFIMAIIIRGKWSER